MGEEKNYHQQGDPASPENTSNSIKDKFLLVAKEKKNLETIILEQNDIIRNLEKENSNITRTLRKYAESHEKMKEKLLDFDILRNMEVSDMKKKISALLSENKKLAAEKDLMLQNLEQDEKNILLKEKRGPEARLTQGAGPRAFSLPDASQELKDLLKMKEHNLAAAAERIRRLEQELTSAQAGLRDIGKEKNSLQNQLEEVSGKLPSPEAGKMYSEQELEQEIDFYSKEILGLKSDTEMLTSSIKNKTGQIDILNEKVAELSRLLGHKDMELHEVIPLLQTKIQQLSDSIEKKMEENSLFAKELADLNDKLSTLTDELIQKDESFLEISEDYQQEKENWDGMSRKYESSLNQREAENFNLEAELANFRSEIPDLKAEIALLHSEKMDLETAKNQLDTELAGLRIQLEDVISEDTASRQRTGILENENLALEDKLSEASRKIAGLEDEISRHVSAFSSHEQLISDLKDEIERDRAELESLLLENAGLKEGDSEKEEGANDWPSEKSELLKKIAILEQAFRILRDDATKEPADDADISQKPANIVPIAIAREKKSFSKRYAVYAVIFVAVVAALLYISKFYHPSEVLKQRPAVTVNADEQLGYNEIYDRNTRTAASGNLRLQATIITGALLRKEEVTELSGFDFNNNIYFRININSLDGPLDQALIRDPLDRLKLTEDTKTIHTSGYRQIDKIRIFYKRQQPMVITFYCAFQKEALGPQRKNLTLSLSDNSLPISLVWDIQTLIANNI